MLPMGLEGAGFREDTGVRGPTAACSEGLLPAMDILLSSYAMSSVCRKSRVCMCVYVCVCVAGAGGAECSCSSRGAFGRQSQGQGQPQVPGALPGAV